MEDPYHLGGTGVEGPNSLWNNDANVEVNIDVDGLDVHFGESPRDLRALLAGNVDVGGTSTALTSLLLLVVPGAAASIPTGGLAAVSSTAGPCLVVSTAPTGSAGLIGVDGSSAGCGPLIGRSAAL